MCSYRYQVVLLYKLLGFHTGSVLKGMLSLPRYDGVYRTILHVYC